MKAIAALALAVYATAVAAEDVPRVTARAEWLVYASNYRVDPGSAFNPGNGVIRQAENVGSSEFRPDFAWSGSPFSVSLKPRWLVDASGDERASRLWLNEANVRWRVADDLSLTAGREVLLWGPAQFWNPSNPFYVSNGKSNAKRELPGKGFVRARWQAGEGVGVAVIAQVDNGASDSGAERVNAFALDFVGEEASAVALVAALPGQSLQWRGWAQRTVDDALLVYGEAAWARRRALVAQRAASPSGWQVVAGDSAYALDALVGAAYTFENGWTANAEYYRHGSGLTPGEMADWSALARDAGTLAASQSAASRLAGAQIAGALDPGTSPLGRRQIGVQLRNGSDRALDWTLRYSRNLDDGSALAVAQISADLGDRWQIWANVALQRGGADREYGRWLDASAMLGVTAFLW